MGTSSPRAKRHRSSETVSHLVLAPGVWHGCVVISMQSLPRALVPSSPPAPFPISFAHRKVSTHTHTCLPVRPMTLRQRTGAALTSIGTLEQERDERNQRGANHSPHFTRFLLFAHWRCTLRSYRAHPAYALLGGGPPRKSLYRCQHQPGTRVITVTPKAQLSQIMFFGVFFLTN